MTTDPISLRDRERMTGLRIQLMDLARHAKKSLEQTLGQTKPELQTHCARACICSAKALRQMSDTSLCSCPSRQPLCWLVFGGLRLLVSLPPYLPTFLPPSPADVSPDRQRSSTLAAGLPVRLKPSTVNQACSPPQTKHLIRHQDSCPHYDADAWR